MLTYFEEFAIIKKPKMVKNLSIMPKILSTFYTLIIVSELTSALEKQIFKSQWSQEIIFPDDYIFTESDSYPSYAEFRIDEDDRSKVNVSVQSFSNGRRKYVCYFSIHQNESFSAYHLTSLKNDFEVITYGAQLPTTIDTNLIIVNMKNCELSHQNLTVTNDPTKFNLRHMATYNDSIDFFFMSASECRDYPCKWSYNITADKWSEPLLLPTLQNFTHDKPITSVFHLANGTSYIFTLGYGEEQSLVSVNTIEDKAPISVELNAESSSPNELSSSYEGVGICYSSGGGGGGGSKVNCTRLDATLRTSFSVELELGHRALLTRALNSKDGGMLLLTCYCSKEANYLCTEYQVDLTEIHADGRYEATKEFAKLDCEPLFSRFLVFEEAGDVCTRIMCYSDRFQDLKLFNIFVNCF